MFPLSKGNPGPCSYSPRTINISEVKDPSRPSTAFAGDPASRVPFPAPNKVPGPNAYPVKDSRTFMAELSSPGRNNPSYAFATREPRNSYLAVNDIPPALHYENAYIENPGALALNRHDLAWHKSTYIRFQEVGKDNYVPGPDR